MTDFHYSGGLINELAPALVSNLATQGISVTVPQVEAALVAWRTAHNNDPVTLSTVEPDFEQIRLRMMDYLRTVDAWKDLLTAGVGQTVLELIAAAGAFAQYGIMRSAQEAFFDSAANDTSIYTLSRTLGVHLMRNRPSYIETTITRTDTTNALVIPRLTQFDVNGVPHFNRDSYSMASGVDSINAVLYQGEIQSSSFSASGTDFQSYVIGDADWTVSDTDVWVKVDGNEYIRDIEGLWKLGPTSANFYENSLPTGEVEIIFGNGINGLRPVIGAVVEVTWARTTGAEPPLVNAGDEIAASVFPELGGTVSTGSRGGDNGRNAEFYRIVSPSLFSATNRAVTKNDYKAIVLTYPTVLDAVIRGQVDINPALTFALNRVEVTLLTSSAWISSDWTTFVNWLKSKYGILALNYVRVDPTPQSVNINVELWCKPQSDLNAVQRAAQTAINNFFKPRLGLIGYPVYLSDLHAVIASASSDIDFVRIINPTSDTTIGDLQYASLGSLTISPNYSVRNTIQGI